jgi:hypothetical protein
MFCKNKLWLCDILVMKLYNMIEHIKALITCVSQYLICYQNWQWCQEFAAATLAVPRTKNDQKISLHATCTKILN